jgi:hypothetical protein
MIKKIHSIQKQKENISLFINKFISGVYHQIYIKNILDNHNNIEYIILST